MTLADEPEHVSRKYKERTNIKHAHASRRRKEHEVDIFTQYKLLDKNRKYISFYSLFQGTYRIFVRNQDCTDSTTFKVEDYVLPRFEVTLTPPKYILATDDTIKYTVCAKWVNYIPYIINSFSPFALSFTYFFFLLWFFIGYFIHSFMEQFFFRGKCTVYIKQILKLKKSLEQPHVIIFIRILFCILFRSCLCCFLSHFHLYLDIQVHVRPACERRGNVNCEQWRKWTVPHSGQ